MNSVLDVKESNGRFIVVRDGREIITPKSTGSSIVTEFSCREDAEKYISILRILDKKKANPNLIKS